MECLVFDACCLINLYAARDVLRHFHVIKFYLPVAVEAETQFLRVKNSDDAFEKQKIDLGPLLESGILTACQIQNEQEAELFVDLARDLGDGEAMAVAIAKARGWSVATDDQKALRVARGLNIKCLTTLDLLKSWAESDSENAKKIGAVLRRLQENACYSPRKTHALFGWWAQHLAKL